MTMFSTAAGSETASVPAPFWGHRSRISWGAILAGAIVSVATAFLLSLFGAAIGAGSINPINATASDLSNFGTGAAIWEIINFAISMAFGGYVAARLSGTHSHLDGELHGITMWAVAVLLGSVLLGQAVLGLLGLAGGGLGSEVSRVVGGPGVLSGIIPPAVSPQAMIDRLQQSLGNSGDPTTMSREQIGAEIATLVRSALPSGSLSQTDRPRLVSLVAALSGVTREEADRRVARMETDARAGLAQIEQSARVAADQVARSTAEAARAFFTALVIGLLAALLGSWLGTRHKRILHPLEHAYAHEPAYGAHLYGRADPASVSVYDDTGRLVSQYLRGVTFPLNKQDLLRLAQSRHAGSGLLQSIERMADRSYASTDEVLRGLGSMAR